MEEILASIRKIVADEMPAARNAERAAARPAAEAAPASSTAPRLQRAAGTGDNGPGSGKGESLAADVASLVSPTVRAEASASFAQLSQAALPKSSRTVEDLVQEMLRPMLQNWLDAHLPGLVERLVRQEIERIAGRS